jgi:hypothetical protein
MHDTHSYCVDDFWCDSQHCYFDDILNEWVCECTHYHGDGD